MALALHRYKVNRLESGAATRWQEGVLSVDLRGLEQRLRGCDSRIEALELQTVAPGSATRILCVKDVVEPRYKVSGDCGSGETRVLDGVAVVTCGPIVGFQEGIIDMSGPGAQHSCFSRMHLLAMTLSVDPGVTGREHEAVVRQAGWRCARVLAELALERAPLASETEHLRWERIESELPRVGYLGLVLTQGLLHDTYIDDELAQGSLPRAFDPCEILDGRIRSGNCVSACDKNTTYHHQNNPIVRQLVHRHGDQLNFCAAVVSCMRTTLDGKSDAARRAVSLLCAEQPDVVIISKEGFGNPDADLMMVIRELAERQIPSVALTDEFAGDDGGSQSLADTTPQARWMVSTGNANERLTLPAMDTVIGPLPDVIRLSGGYPHSLHSDGSLEVEIQALIGATNELGFESLRCRTV